MKQEIWLRAIINLAFTNKLRQSYMTIYQQTCWKVQLTWSKQHHEPLDMDKGVLILLQKPGKPVGPLTSLRPNVLLSALWKTLSLIVLSRIPTKVDNFLSCSQSEPWFVQNTCWYLGMHEFLMYLIVISIFLRVMLRLSYKTQNKQPTHPQPIKSIVFLVLQWNGDLLCKDAVVRFLPWPWQPPRSHDQKIERSEEEIVE